MVDCVWQCISPFLACNYLYCETSTSQFTLAEGRNEYDTEEPCRNRIGREVGCQHIIAEISSFFNDLECDHNQESNAKWRSPNFPQYLFLFFLALQHCRRESMHLYKIKSPHCRDVCRQLFVISVVLSFQTR